MAVEQQNIPAWRIACIGAASVLLLAVIIIGVNAGYTYARDAEASRKAAAWANAPLLDLQSKQLENLTTPRWIDRPNNIVAIPIDQAVKQLLAQGSVQLPSTPAPAAKPANP